ncbi:MAG: hypothetical protein HZC28_16755 [Spirochaetes bacterium]|nr:hypothetical protein [Spirochaetota bacterium]
MNSIRVVIAISIIAAATLPAADITVGAATARTVSKNLYGINLWRAFDPETAESPEYQANLAAMGVSVVRFHNMGMSKWIDASNRCLNTNAVQRVMAALASKFPIKLVTICKPPFWMDENNDKRLDDDHIADYAAWCADMVHYINIECNAGVQWWETLNEAELGGYKQKGDGAVLAGIFRACKAAMLAKDPSIHVGANAWSWTMPAQASELLSIAGNEIAFYSYHGYVTGSSNADMQSIYDKAVTADNTKVRNALTERGFTLPVWLDEWNMFYNWQADSKRHFMVSYRSAVYDALHMKNAAESGGVDYMLAWNDSDNTYGKMSTKYKFFPGGYVFMLYNKYFTGTILSAASSESAVVPFAVRNADGSVALSLANRSETPQEVSISADGNFTQYTQYSVETNGIQTNLSREPLRSLPLAPESVTVLVLK